MRTTRFFLSQPDSFLRRFVQSLALSRVSHLLKATPPPPSKIKCSAAAVVMCPGGEIILPLYFDIGALYCSSAAPMVGPFFPICSLLRSFMAAAVAARATGVHPWASSTGGRLHALAAVTPSHIRALSHSVRRLQNVQRINRLRLLIISSYIGRPSPSCYHYLLFILTAATEFCMKLSK